MSAWLDGARQTVVLFASQYTDVRTVRSVSQVMLCNRKLGPIP